MIKGVEKVSVSAIGESLASLVDKPRGDATQEGVSRSIYHVMNQGNRHGASAWVDRGGLEESSQGGCRESEGGGTGARGHGDCGAHINF